MKLRIFMLAIFVVGICILSGCKSTVTTLPVATPTRVEVISTTSPMTLPTDIILPSIVPTKTILPTETLIGISTSTSIPTATITPISTLSSVESEKYMEELLEDNGGCSLPCVWGIIPGKTSSVDTIDFFEHLGWEGSVSYDVYSTGRDLKASSIVIRTSIYPPGEGKVIEKVHVAIGGNDFLRLVKYLSFTNVLKVLGKPTKIQVFVGTTPDFLEPVETSFELLLYYDLQNTLIEYAGTAVKTGDHYQICPARPNARSSTMNPLSGNINLFVGEAGGKNTPEELVGPFWTLPGYYISSEKALGMDRDQFFEASTQTAEPNCFYSKIDAWRR